MKKNSLIFFLFWVSFGFEPSSFARNKCAQINDHIPFSFVKAQEVTNEWYTPWTSQQFLWKNKYCGTTTYIKNGPKGGLEHQYYLYPRRVEKYAEAPTKKRWKKLVNQFWLDADEENPIVSLWRLVFSGRFRFPLSPKVATYVVALDEDHPEQPQWWAAYYCSKHLRSYTEGLDIRSATLPLDQGIIDRIMEEAARRGVPRKVLSEVQPAPYQGCWVNGVDGKYFVP